MHTWTLVPHAHAQLGASARTCTLGRRRPLRTHIWTPVPCAHAHLGASAPCTSTFCSCICRDGLHYCVEGCFSLRKERAVYAEAYGCNQPRAFGHNHRRRFPHICWACATFPKTTRGPTNKGDACRMDVAECSRLLAATCPGIRMRRQAAGWGKT